MIYTLGASESNKASDGDAQSKPVFGLSSMISHRVWHGLAWGELRKAYSFIHSFYRGGGEGE